MERATAFGIHLSNLNPITKSNLEISRRFKRLAFRAAAPQEIDRSFFQFFIPHERRKRRAAHSPYLSGGLGEEGLKRNTAIGGPHGRLGSLHEANGQRSKAPR